MPVTLTEMAASVPLPGSFRSTCRGGPPEIPPGPIVVPAVVRDINAVELAVAAAAARPDLEIGSLFDHVTQYLTTWVVGFNLFQLR